ncbi:hypothetical protein [Oryzibacter oryziterrae]|uniref:hypothetical protein n=1 Tax=Oryzibacter oryziterrae TaxID=2766474 RepID=UPI001F29F399|nr:hypothetical protein [Oryzibacter oryziterrae]
MASFLQFDPAEERSFVAMVRDTGVIHQQALQRLLDTDSDEVSPALVAQLTQMAEFYQRVAEEAADRVTVAPELSSWLGSL